MTFDEMKEAISKNHSHWSLGIKVYPGGVKITIYIAARQFQGYADNLNEAAMEAVTRLKAWDREYVERK